MSSWHRLRESTLSVAAVREVDRIAVERFHMQSIVLMENAAAGCARWMFEMYGARRRAVILCGRGNNGGDGLAIARHLRLQDWHCEVIVLGPTEQLSADALANWKILTARHTRGCTMVDAEAARNIANERMIEGTIRGADLIVDAMLGTGASGTPREPFKSWIEFSNREPAQRVAIDIPTGLDAETGAVALPTFQAHATLTFVARKPGFAVALAQRALGLIEVLPIGIPIELIDELLAQSVSSAPGGGS